MDEETRRHITGLKKILSEKEFYSIGTEKVMVPQNGDGHSLGDKYIEEVFSIDAERFTHSWRERNKARKNLQLYKFMGDDGESELASRILKQNPTMMRRMVTPAAWIGGMIAAYFTAMYLTDYINR